MQPNIIFDPCVLSMATSTTHTLNKQVSLDM